MIKSVNDVDEDVNDEIKRRTRTRRKRRMRRRKCGMEGINAESQLIGT